MFLQPIYVITLCLDSNWILLLEIPLHSALYRQICILTVGARNCHVIEDVLGLETWNCRSSDRLIAYNWFYGDLWVAGFWKINGTTLQSFFLSIIVSGGDTMTYNDVSSSCVPCGLLKMIISNQSWLSFEKTFYCHHFYRGTNYEPWTQNRWRSLHGLVVCLMLFTIFVRLGSTSTCVLQQLLLGLHTG